MKHLFTVLTGAAIVVVAWGGYHIFSSSSGGAPNARPAGADIPEVPGVKAEERAALDELESSLDGLERRLVDASKHGSEDKPVLALAPEKERSDERDEDARPKKASAPPPPPMPTRHLSLIMDGSERRAVIDGELVSEGTELDKDGRVVEIGSNSVRIRESHGRHQEVALDDLDGLGTLRAVSNRGSEAREVTQ